METLAQAYSGDRPEGDAELDRGPKAGHAVERLCAVTREHKSPDDMIRFVVAPEGGVVADVRRKLPGRGLWVTARRAIVTEAMRRRVFARGFKAEVQVPPDLADVTERLLERAALDALAMAHKAGLVLLGFMKVENALARGEAVAILQAHDAAEDGRRKIKAALRRGNEVSEGRPVGLVSSFSGEHLDLALGRPNVVHAALLAGSSTDGFLARVSRLAMFRDNDADGAAATRDHAARDNDAHE